MADERDNAAAMELGDIRAEIDGYMNGPMKNFFEKFFTAYSYSWNGDILETVSSKVGYREEHDIPLPLPPPSEFPQWLAGWILTHPGRARGDWHLYPPSTSTAPSADRKFTQLAFNPDTISKGWSGEQVLGLLCRSKDLGYRDGLLQLSLSARALFAAQPDRLFLHAFYVRDTRFECFVFDRAGLYCSDGLSAEDPSELGQMLTVILTYGTMSDESCGHGRWLNADRTGRHLRFQHNGEEENSLFRLLYIDEKPLATREGLFGDAMTCYRGMSTPWEEYTHAVKIRWLWAKDKGEREFLERAMEKKAWGAVRLQMYAEWESTAELRDGMRWGKHRKFSERNDDGGAATESADSAVDGFAKHTVEARGFFQNRRFVCTVTSPLGRPLSTFTSRLELLRVFRDAIKCHRSLLLDAGIIHGDISEGNILIVDNQPADAPQGILIDLDSATYRDEEPDPESDTMIVGTKMFMAIAVLQGDQRHTYRHDLESFLYVFLWTILTGDAEDLPAGSRLLKWAEEGTGWAELAARKKADMEEGMFEEVLDEFGQEYAGLVPLAKRLREVLFPVRDGEVWMEAGDGNDEVDELYSGMISAFDDAIEREG